jgi:hypothetical protein
MVASIHQAGQEQIVNLTAILKAKVIVQESPNAQSRCDHPGGPFQDLLPVRCYHTPERVLDNLLNNAIRPFL